MSQEGIYLVDLFSDVIDQGKVVIHDRAVGFRQDELFQEVSALRSEEVREGLLNAAEGGDGMDAVFETASQANEFESVADELAGISDRARGSIGFRQKIGSQEVCKNVGADLIRLNTFFCDCFGFGGVCQFNGHPKLFEHIAEPVVESAALQSNDRALWEWGKIGLNHLFVCVI